ncbi:MAG: OmpH family outer membrane protein [Bacteroidota bacterium]
MKKIVFVLVCALFAAGVSAQKIGHIHSDSLLQIMPEYEAAQQQLEALSLEYEKALKQQEAELQAKYEAYLQLPATTPAAIKQNKEAELQQLQQGLQEFAVTIQNDLDQEQTKLLKPVYDKAKDAIQAVAKANGFTYVIDASTGVLLFENGEDIMGLVKTHLGLL